MEKSFRSYVKFMAKSFKDWVIYKTSFPANIYLIKFNNRYIKKRCEICSKLTIKTGLELSLRTSQIAK